MSRWIDANEMIKVLAFFLDNMGITLFGRSGKDLARSLVFQADKGKDVVEVIRCGECKKAHLTYDGDCKYCEEWKDDDGNYIEVYHDKNFFCGYGERKDDE